MNNLDRVKEYLRSTLDEPSFKKWIEPLKYIGMCDDHLFVGTPDKKIGLWLKQNLLESVNSYTLKNFNFKLKIVPLSEEEEIASESVSSKRSQQHNSNLIKKHTFDSFVQCDSNRISYSFAYSVSEFPGRSYNPLYIYSDVGLGKTHLMNAIGNRIIANNHQINVIYLTSRDFMIDYVEYTRLNKRSEFIKKYTSTDILLIDDIQFITKWEGTSEQFYYIFNNLIQQEKQIVMCSDTHPDNIPDLEKRIKTRFLMGGIADILPYDLETRMAILKKKINDEKQKNFRNQFNIPDDVIYYIASGIKDNIRTLEGALQRLLGYAELKYSDSVETPLSIEFAKEALKPFINLEKKVLTIEMIQEFISEKFSIKMEDLKSKNNSPKIAMPRQIAMYLIKKLTKFPLAEIGNSFGGKHHTTVIHSIEKIYRMAEADPDFSKKLNSYVEYFQD